MPDINITINSNLLPFEVGKIAVLPQPIAIESISVGSPVVVIGTITINKQPIDIGAVVIGGDGLKGDKGDPGDTGPQGPPGIPGISGGGSSNWGGM